MSIAHVVFDLPLEGHFDYLIPDELTGKVVVGLRVKVFFGPKPVQGYVISIADATDIVKLKPIKGLYDERPVFDGRDLKYARIFADYYGCSLGEALAIILRHRKKPALMSEVSRTSKSFLYHCPDGKYHLALQQAVQGHSSYFIAVPDAFIAAQLPLEYRSRVGLRSAMFEAMTHCSLIIVIDEDNSSHKQEQSPMYDTRQAILMAGEVYGFDIAFIGSTPSVELMHLVNMKVVQYYKIEPKEKSKIVVIDLSNYRYLEKGLLSPPARNALQVNITNKKPSLIVLNRKGSYSVTRCECGHILKCPRCDVAMAYSRSQKQFECRHCIQHMQLAPACPLCGKTQWKSFGMGVEQLQKELALLFATAKVVAIDRTTQELPKYFDILIATQAILRFKGQVTFETTIVVDFDSELNRQDMRSSFKGWSLIMQVRSMAQQLLLQTRNLEHHVLKALASDNAELFYSSELALRRELGFAPFMHWVVVTSRSKVESLAQNFVADVHNELSINAVEGIQVSGPQQGTPTKLRDQYRFCIVMQGVDVVMMVAMVKAIIVKLKRSRVITTLNVDP